MKARTYDEWRDLGYQVQKGEKATGRNKLGVPTFTREQVDDAPDFFDEADGPDLDCMDQD